MPGEVPVREYAIAELRNWIRSTRTEGQLQVTSKRVIFSAPGRNESGRGAVYHEFAIGEVAGIGATNNFRFSGAHVWLGLVSIFVAAVVAAVVTFLGGWAVTNLFAQNPPFGDFLSQSVRQVANYQITEVSQLSLIFGLFAGFGGVALYFIVRGRFWFRLIMLGVSFGAFFIVGLTGNTFSYVLFGISVLINIYGLVAFARLPDLVVYIYVRGGAAVEIVRAKARFAAITGRTGTGYAEVAPTPDAVAAIYELGAVITDINNQGDAGVKKWSM